MKFSDLVLGLIVGAIGVAVMVTAAGFPQMAGMAYGPEFFPILLGAGFCLCGLSLLVSGLKQRRTAPGIPLVRMAAWMSDGAALRRVAMVFATVIFFILVSDHAGFLLTSMIAMLALLLALGATWLQTSLVAIAFPLLVHFLFSNALRVPLPRGVIETWLF
ncbi:MAG TPA: tripartite tricarboxylate transporter TctB family protein [Rhodobacteraceae bacterium]|nr:tripartite tricarboxylate transporter TctB family protein [Paracoccaceae bacterium]